MGYIITKKSESSVSVTGPGIMSPMILRVDVRDASFLCIMLNLAHQEGQRDKSKQIIDILNRHVFSQDDEHAGGEKDRTIRKLEEEKGNLHRALERVIGSRHPHVGG